MPITNAGGGRIDAIRRLLSGGGRGALYQQLTLPERYLWTAALGQHAARVKAAAAAATAAKEAEAKAAAEAAAAAREVGASAAGRGTQGGLPSSSAIAAAHASTVAEALAASVGPAPSFDFASLHPDSISPAQPPLSIAFKLLNTEFRGKVDIDLTTWFAAFRAVFAQERHLAGSAQPFGRPTLSPEEYWASRRSGGRGSSGGAARGSSKGGGGSTAANRRGRPAKAPPLADVVDEDAGPAMPASTRGEVLLVRMQGFNTAWPAVVVTSKQLAAAGLSETLQATAAACLKGAREALGSAGASSGKLVLFLGEARRPLYFAPAAEIAGTFEPETALAPPGAGGKASKPPPETLRAALADAAFIYSAVRAADALPSSASACAAEVAAPVTPSSAGLAASDPALGGGSAGWCPAPGSRVRAINEEGCIARCCEVLQVWHPATADAAGSIGSGRPRGGASGRQQPPPHLQRVGVPVALLQRAAGDKPSSPELVHGTGRRRASSASSAGSSVSASVRDQPFWAPLRVPGSSLFRVFPLYNDAKGKGGDGSSGSSVTSPAVVINDDDDDDDDDAQPAPTTTSTAISTATSTGSTAAAVAAPLGKRRARPAASDAAEAIAGATDGAGAAATTAAASGASSVEPRAKRGRPAKAGSGAESTTVAPASIAASSTAAAAPAPVSSSSSEPLVLWAQTDRDWAALPPAQRLAQLEGRLESAFARAVLDLHAMGILRFSGARTGSAQRVMFDETALWTRRVGPTDAHHAGPRAAKAAGAGAGGTGAAGDEAGDEADADAEEGGAGDDEDRAEGSAGDAEGSSAAVGAGAGAQAGGMADDEFVMHLLAASATAE
jgi:hypothetical protein